MTSTPLSTARTWTWCANWAYDVLMLTEPVDAFMLMQFHKYKEHTLTNVAAANLELPAETETAEQEEPAASRKSGTQLPDRTLQGPAWEKVNEVRMTQRLADSPARLVDPKGVLVRRIPACLPLPG